MLTHIVPAAIQKLQESDWPGNVRELRNVIERAIILAREGPILLNHVRLDNSQGSLTPVARRDNFFAPFLLGPVSAS